jgi:endoglucanase
MIDDLTTFLKSLISQPGLSGYEKPVRLLIEDAWKPLVDELSVSALGSLHGLKRGSGEAPRLSVLVSTHMDAIGMIVTAIEGEFVHFTNIGGLDPRVLPGQQVIVHGRQDLPAVIAMPTASLLPGSLAAAEKTVPIENLLIDTGLSASALARTVRVGDLVSFAQPPVDLPGELLAGHSLDNRASVAVLTHALEILQGRLHPWDVWAVASTQEEVTLAGARTSAYQINPSLAVIVDVTFAASPGSPAHRTFPLAKGPTLGWGANIHPALFEQFKALAEQLEIPAALEVLPGHSGTDAYAIQVVRAGIPSIVIGIPLRYMHTPVEIISLKDIRRAGRLIAEFIARLGPDTLAQLAWNDEPGRKA